VSRPHYITPPIEEGLPLFGAARASDPATSHAAAAKAGGLATRHQRQILAALLEGPAGASGIAARCGLLPHQVNKRLGEMGRAGLIETTGRDLVNATGRREREWRRTT
jgi:DNA-binding MarR family transcriptional regulator